MLVEILQRSSKQRTDRCLWIKQLLCRTTKRISKTGLWLDPLSHYLRGIPPQQIKSPGPHNFRIMWLSSSWVLGQFIISNTLHTFPTEQGLVKVCFWAHLWPVQVNPAAHTDFWWQASATQNEDASKKMNGWMELLEGGWMVLLED